MKILSWKLAGLAMLVIGLVAATITTQLQTKLNEKAATCYGTRTDYIWSITYKDPVCNGVRLPPVDCSSSNLNAPASIPCEVPTTAKNTTFSCSSFLITTQVPCSNTVTQPQPPSNPMGSCSGVNAECRTDLTNNCGEIGKVAGSGTCNNGGRCCIQGSGGSNPPPLSCSVNFSNLSANQSFTVGQQKTVNVFIKNNRAGMGNTGSFVSVNLSTSNTSLANLTPASVTVGNDGLLQKTYSLTLTTKAVGTLNLRASVNMKPCPACSTQTNVCSVNVPVKIVPAPTQTPQ